MGGYARRDRAGVSAALDEQFRVFPILSERRRQPAQTLSGGEQQMLAIARAMMSRPRLLLLDEPTLGLAPLVVARIMSQITSLRSAGGTVLVVEQNARAALGIADRGYVLENGRISTAGKAQALLSDAAVQEAYLGGAGGDARAMEQRIREKRRAILGRSVTSSRILPKWAFERMCACAASACSSGNTRSMGSDSCPRLGHRSSRIRCATSLTSSGERVRKVTPMKCRRRSACRLKSNGAVMPPSRPTFTMRPPMAVACCV